MPSFARYTLAAAVLASCTSATLDARSQDSVTRARPTPAEPAHSSIGLLYEGGDPTAPEGHDEIGVSFSSSDARGLEGVAEPRDLYAPAPLTFAPGGLELSGAAHGSDRPATGYLHWITRVRDRRALARWLALPRRIAAAALRLLRR